MPDIPRELSVANVSRETFAAATSLFEQQYDRFSFLVDNWLRWNKSINLFSKNTGRSLLEKHIVHSLLLGLVTEEPGCAQVVDAGTGGGLPGLPLAMVNGDKDFLLIDKVQKKCLAVREIIRTLGIPNATVIPSDIEKTDISKPSRIVSKHAFPVRTLLHAAADKNWTEIAMLKGNEVLSEIDPGMFQGYRFSFHGFDRFQDPFFLDRGVLLIHKKNRFQGNEQQ